MGQARKRGSFEQRQQEGILKREKEEALREEELRARREVYARRMSPKQKLQMANIAAMMAVLAGTPNNYV